MPINSRLFESHFEPPHATRPWMHNCAKYHNSFVRYAAARERCNAYSMSQTIQV